VTSSDGGQRGAVARGSVCCVGWQRAWSFIASPGERNGRTKARKNGTARPRWLEIRKRAGLEGLQCTAASGADKMLARRTLRAGEAGADRWAGPQQQYHLRLV
jgi:hypothetical protein